MTFLVVLVALAATGYTSARIGGSAALRPAIRLVVGGALALGGTFLIGTLLGTSGLA